MMKKLTLKILLLSLLLILSGYIIIWHFPLDRDNYLNALNDKYRLLETTPQPRIICIGGSNLAFGLDSRMIQNVLNRNVVNMGIHAGLGLRFILHDIKNCLQPGDTVLVFPEYIYFYNDLINGSKTLMEAGLFYPRVFSFFNSEHAATLIQNAPLVMQRRFNGWYRYNYYYLVKSRRLDIADDDPFNKKTFNELGDAENHLHRTYTKALKAFFVLSKDITHGEEALTLLDDFYRTAQDSNINVFLLYQPLPVSMYKKNKKQLHTLHTWLKDNLNFTVLGTPEDFVYPDDHFFDSVNHLNYQGRTARTKKVIEYLRTVIH